MVRMSPSRQRYPSSAYRELHRALHMNKDRTARLRMNARKRKAKKRRKEANRRREEVTRRVSCTQRGIRSGPLVPPSGMSTSEYLAALQGSKTCKSTGGRWHVEGACYGELIDDSQWNIIDIRELSDVLHLELEVRTNDKDLGSVCDTTISIADCYGLDGGERTCAILC